MTTDQRPNLFAYRLREKFTLIELACLLHGNLPKQVWGVAFDNWRKRNDALGYEFFTKSHDKVFIAALDACPEMVLGGAEGETLAQLKTAVGAGMLHIIDADYAKRLAQNFGLVYPFDIAPAQPPAKPAPVVAVELDADAPVPMADTPEQSLPTKDIATCFDGLNGWDTVTWPKRLSGSNWLHTARTALGGAGGASSMWNPLEIAQLVYDKTKGARPQAQILKAFNHRFNTNPVLAPWKIAFNEYYAMFSEAD